MGGHRTRACPALRQRHRPTHSRPPDTDQASPAARRPQRRPRRPRQPHMASLEMTFYPPAKQFPAELQRRRLRRRARLLEPRPPRRLRGHPHPHAQRPRHRRVRRLPHRLRHPGRPGLGPARRRRRRQGRHRCSSPTTAPDPSGTSPTPASRSSEKKRAADSLGRSFFCDFAVVSASSDRRLHRVIQPGGRHLARGRKLPIVARSRPGQPTHQSSLHRADVEQTPS